MIAICATMKAKTSNSEEKNRGKVKGISATKHLALKEITLESAINANALFFGATKRQAWLAI